MARRPVGHTRQGVTAVTIVFGMVVLVYAASPYVALWRMSVAIRSHNVDALRADIDWNRVRDGLKGELAGDVSSPAKTIAAVKQASLTTTSTMDADELPDFGDSFAKQAVGSVVDQDCDAEHVEAMLGGGGPKAAGLIAQARRMLAWAFFTGPKSFQALLRLSDDPREAPVRVRMVFTGGHGWRVTNVWLPQQMLSPPDANAT